MTWYHFVIVVEAFLIVWLLIVCLDKSSYIKKLRDMYFCDLGEAKRDYEERAKKSQSTRDELLWLEGKLKENREELKVTNKELANAKIHLQNTLKQNADLDICILRSRKAPPGVTFAQDGYPIYWDSPSGKPYGDFTVYLNSKAGVYHIDHYCAPYFADTTHLFKALSISRPCKRCAKKYENFRIPEWYSNP